MFLIYHNTTIYLVRHGSTALNESGAYCGKTDIKLSPIGIGQMEELKKSLSKVVFDKIYVSSLKRTWQSASIIKSVSENDDLLEKDECLDEMDFGLWEGLNNSQISSHYSSDWKKWTEDWKNSMPTGGESLVQMYSRVESFTKKMIKSSTGKKILIVAHQGSLRIIVSILMKLGYDGFWNFKFDHGTYSVIEMDRDICVLHKINCK